MFSSLFLIFTGNRESGINKMITFQSKYYDSESGFYYYYHRYYDPQRGRIITEDPLGISGGLNLYRFVNNNPVNYVDPWGLINVLDIVKDTISMSLYDTFYLSFGWLTDIDSPYKCRRECVRACWKEFVFWRVADKIMEPSIKGEMGVIKHKIIQKFFKESITGKLSLITKTSIKLFPIIEKSLGKASFSYDAYKLGKCLRKCGRK